jgi:hypothetical protein
LVTAIFPFDYGCDARAKVLRDDRTCLLAASYDASRVGDQVAKLQASDVFSFWFHL